MSISPPGAAPAPGFEQPFEMLHACHERVHRTLDLLGRLQEHVTRQGADDQARQAAGDVLRYFDLAAPQHHCDEELHVFPVLLASPEARLREAALRLQEEHATLARAWAGLRPVLKAWAAGATATARDDAGERIHQFGALYRNHIALEEQVAFPGAVGALDTDAVHAMSREMMVRRGVERP